eukprot:4172347-Pyramimonas_sp.AAC.1
MSSRTQANVTWIGSARYWARARRPVKSETTMLKPRGGRPGHASRLFFGRTSNRYLVLQRPEVQIQPRTGGQGVFKVGGRRELDL